MSRVAVEFHSLKEYATTQREALVNLVATIVEPVEATTSLNASYVATIVEPVDATTSLNTSYVTAARSAIALPLPSTASLERFINRPRVGVGCVLISSAHPGCVLVGERLGSHGAGRWALPGGHLEIFQTWGDCASMELSEECGIELPASAWRLLTVTNDVMKEEWLHYITIFVAATIQAAELATLQNTEPDKCVGWHWLTIEALRAKEVFIPLQHLLADEAAVHVITNSATF